MKAIITCALILAISAGVAAESVSVYIGTYTKGNSQAKGIYHSVLDLKTGKLSPPTIAAETENPSFLTISPNGRFLYAVSESNETGSVKAFRIHINTDKLEYLNQQPSRGVGPCYVSTDHVAKNLFVANYTSGSIAVIPIKSDGTLAEPTASVQFKGQSIDPKRQKEPHPHSINAAPDDRFVFTADLGTDKIMIHRLDCDKGFLNPNDPPFVNLKPGSGPRHFAFHPDGKYAYVINELNSTIIAFDYESESGRLTEIQSISTVPDDYDGTNYCAEVCVHSNGAFLYGSNRGHDSIAAYRIDKTTGKLTLVEYEHKDIETPRHFGIDPTGNFCLVANQNNGSVVVFRINPQTGNLEPTGNKISVPMPVCIKFLR